MPGNPNMQKIGKRKTATGQKEPDWLFPAPEKAAPTTKNQNDGQSKKTKQEKQLAKELLKRRAAGEPSKPTPPTELLDIVGSYLLENDFTTTGQSFQSERKKMDQSAATQGLPSLTTIYNEWCQLKGETKGKASATENDTTVTVKAKKTKGDASSSSDSSSSSGSSDSEDSDVEMADAPQVKKVSARKSSSSSSASSSSDSEADEPAPPKVNGLKRKAPSSSESSTSSDSDSSSSSEEEAPKSKKAKIQADSSDDSSASDSDSSSEESTDSDSSDSDSSTNSTAQKVPLPESDSESSSSDSESESEAEVPKKTVRKPISSDTSATLSDAPKKASDSSSDSSSSDSGSDSDSVKVTTTVPKTTVRKLSPPLPPTPVIKPYKKTNVPFSRIPKDVKVDERLASNAYVPYDYAQKAHEDLIVTRGKGFTKEKNKKKRGSYRGGYIDVEGKKGIKFDD